MSRMEKLAKLIGVEIGERFKATGWNGFDFRMTDEKMEENLMCSGWTEASPTKFFEIMTGKSAVIKEPWKPKSGESYFTVFYYGVEECTWRMGMSDLVLYATGNCFKTRAEAGKNREKIFNYFKKIYEDGKPLIGADEWRDKE